MPKHEQRIALVTGANKGIGLEVVRQLARKSYRVFLSARDEKAGRAAAEKLQKDGATKEDGEIIFLQMDVSEAESIQAAAKELARQCDRLDALVNNAGILFDHEDKDVLTLPREIFETTLRTNTLGALLVSQAFVPFLKKSDAPRIVNVSSTGGQLSKGGGGWAAYSISKTALNGVTVQLAAALPKFAVNCVCPGWVRTDMGGSNATRSVAEGASGIVWLAADAPQNETGKFWKDRKVIPW